MRSLCLGLLAVTSCVASRGGGVVFPARYDIAPVTMAHLESGTAGVHAAGALSWASASPDPANRIDVALGYQVESGRAPERATGGAEVTERRADATAAAAGDATAQASDPAADPDRRRLLHGPFLELGGRLRGTRHGRVWLALRGELLAQEIAGRTRSGVGAIVRVHAELFASVRERSAVGSIGLGPFLELGVRELPTGTTALVGLAGLSLRLPFVAVK